MGREVPGVGGMTDFLLELRSEEIPARMQAGARADLEKLFRKEMVLKGVELALDAIEVYSTPRRLALIAKSLPDFTDSVHQDFKGPKIGAPDAAIEGFLRRYSASFSELIEKNGALYLERSVPGQGMPSVLAEAIPAIVRAFPWPKSMRWGPASLSTEALRWVRPLSGIVAIFGEELVECEVGGVASGYATLGHRFHHPGAITIGGAHDYADKLRACHVIVNHVERQDLIRDRAAEAARAAGLILVADEGLVVENAGLTEWPVPLIGRFDAEFLEVPPEVIQLTARVNQKYFVCEDASGKLANAFVCTANIEASDGGAGIIHGNRKVLAARLSDARFFWDQDRKVPLAEQAKKLERITFHEKLGTVADKVERVAKLARWLVEEGIVGANPSLTSNTVRPVPVEGLSFTSSAAPEEKGSASTSSARTGSVSADHAELADLAEQAARLCKADLVTEMVGEFPELQGLMGGYYARAEGLDERVADAIHDHYKPVGQGDEVPTAPVTVAVSLADKLDTLVGFYAIGEVPTGSRDPFALRRAALGIISIVTQCSMSIPMQSVFVYSILQLDLVRKTLGENFDWETEHLGEIDQLTANDWVRAEVQLRLLRNWKKAVTASAQSKELSQLPKKLLAFLADRLKVQQREAGVRHDLIDAVFALGGEDDLVRLLARVHALQAFVGTEDGANLLAGYKRAANILKKEGWDTDPAHVERSRDMSGQHPSTSLGMSGEGIPRDGEEDPFAMVDDPDVAFAARERAALQKMLSYAPEPAEKALIDALDAAGPQAASAVAGEDFAAAMTALASLRAPIDAFFDEVTVNDTDRAKRTARLGLLARFRDAVHQVADFSKIEG